MKNLLLTTTMIFIAAAATAQLSVKPNGTNPSYIYSNDVQIYVEDDVVLTKNAAGDFEASIYLRGDSQLFQGGTAASNSGDGLLSVYQTTNADQYDYNFWSSPVGLNAGGAGNTMNGPLRLNVSDDTTPTLPTDIGTTNFIGGLAGSSTADELNIASYWLFRLLDETTSWEAVGGTDGVAPGFGFTMKGTNTSTGSTPLNDGNIQQYDFRGRPNSGNITIDLTTDESTLSGNPYPSALDLVKFFNDNSSIEEIRFWDENRAIQSHFFVDNQGGYGTWIPAGADETNLLQGMYTAAPFLNYNNDGTPDGTQNAVGGAIYPRRFSPIGQGFIIKARPLIIDPSVTFSNSQRVFIPIDGTNSVFRSNETAAIANSSPTLGLAVVSQEEVEENANTSLPYMRLNAYFPGSHRREMALLFSNKATKGFDRGFDAIHPMDATSEMAMTIDDGSNLVIQTLAYNADYQIPLMVKVDIPGTVVFSAYEETNLPFKDAYLFDAELDTYQLITGGNIATMNVKTAGETTDRFFIVFKSKIETFDQKAEESGLILAKETVDVFQDNRLSVMEILNPERFDIKDADVFDMSGKLVHNESNIGMQTRYSFPTATLSDGVYIVRLTTQENLVLDYKVTIFNKR